MKQKGLSVKAAAQVSKVGPKTLKKSILRLESECVDLSKHMPVRNARAGRDGRPPYIEPAKVEWLVTFAASMELCNLNLTKDTFATRCIVLCSKRTPRPSRRRARWSTSC
jgi:transposase